MTEYAGVFTYLGLFGRLPLCGEQMSNQLTETNLLSGRIKSEDWSHGVDGP